MNERLEQAYRDTAYEVDGPEGRFVLRIDQTSAALDNLLMEHGTRCWALITACNPQSEPLSVEQNRQRHEDLQRLVGAAAYPILSGRGVADDGAWPAEESLLILGISPEDAATLGRRYEQNAILLGEIGSPVRMMSL